MGYLTTCPLCGSQLQPHVGDAQSAPWLCTVCRRGWWCAELTGDARRLFRPLLGDFGHQPAAGRDVEIHDAMLRGHSVPDHMLGLPGVAERLAEFTKRRPR